MHLWDGLFRARSADSPGNSPRTTQLSGAGPDPLPITSNSSSTSADPSQPSWHPVATANSSDSSRQYQQQLSRSAPDLGANATAHNHSSSSSQPVQIPESKVLPYSRLLARSASSISPSPTQNILADSPGTEVLLGLHNLAAAAAAGSSSNGSSTQPQQQQQQNSNLILRAQSRSKRPPLAPSPQGKPQYLSNAAAAGSSSNAPISPRRGGIASQLTAAGSYSSAAAAAASAWIPRVPSNSSLTAMYSSPIGSSSSSGHRNDASRVLDSSGSTGSRRHQHLLQNALHSGSPSPSTEGLLASSLQLSPRAAAAAAAVGEAVAAVAGNPYHPHHQHTMQLLVQHQQLQMQQLQQQQSGLSAAAAAGSVGGSVDGYLNPVGDYYGERSAAQQSPQSPRVLSRRNSSSSRLAELGTSPGLIEASFMGMAARPSRKLTHSHSFTAGSSSSRRRALQQMQHAEHLAARQQQEQQQRAFGSRGGSAANSPRESQSGSGASLADWDSSTVTFGMTDHITSTAAAAARDPDPGVLSEVPDQIGSSSSSRDLDQLLTRHWAGRGSNPSSSAASTPMLFDTRYRGGTRALPGQQGLTWITRADDGESAARGLLGLPRPGIPLSPSSSDQQQQRQGLGRSNTFGARSSGSVSEIEANETDQGSGEVLFSGFGGHSRTSEQQQQQGRGMISGGLIRRSASHGELMATPAKIGAAAAAGSALPTNSRQPGASAAIPAANGGGSSSSNGQVTYTGRQASFKRVAAAIAAAPATSPTSSAAAAAAAAAAAEDDVEEPLRRQDSFNSYTSARSADSSHSYGTLPGYLAAAAAAAAAAGDYRSGTPGSARPSPRTSPRAAAAAARYAPNGSSSAYFGRSFTRSGGNMGYGATLGRSPSTAGFPTCLICLDQLTPDDFECGEALQLDCRCKGEVALRHRSCAEKWSRIKGNTICDVCKAPILNLPDVPPLPLPPGQGVGNQAATLLNEAGLWGSEEPPAAADYIFDCIRVTWVVLIVCILFLELSVSRSFLTGALIGSAYVAVAASWSAAQRRRRQNRLAAAAAAAGWMGEQRVPLLHGQVGGIEGLPV